MARREGRGGGIKMLTEFGGENVGKKLFGCSRLRREGKM